MRTGGIFSSSPGRIPLYAVQLRIRDSGPQKEVCHMENKNQNQNQNQNRNNNQNQNNNENRNNNQNQNQNKR